MDSSVKRDLDASEYVVFAGLLFASAIIGVYFAYQDRKKTSTDNYYFAEKKMNPIAVGVSVSVTYLSSFTMIGVPAEVYIVGTAFLWAPMVIFIIAIITGMYYVPLYCRNDFKTIYEYLGVRFGRITGKIASFMITISTILHMSASIFVPSLSLSAVTPIGLNWSIAFTSIICTFYTTLGGMKAVIWTDLLQASMMITGVISLFICTVVDIGGVDEMTAALERGQRKTFFSFGDFDISSRATPLAVSLGAFVIFLNNMAFSQSAVQRFQSCRSVRHAKMSVVVYIFPTMLIVYMAIANGLVMYAYYEGCDPVLAGILRKPDQKIPFMALGVFRRHMGLTGLFIAAVYSGCLSTVSSGLNSFSIVILEEIVALRPPISEKRKLLLGKLLAIVLGTVVMTVAYLLSIAEGNIFKVFIKISGLFSGPITGLFFLGMYFPWANFVGSLVAMGVSYFVLFWMFFGSMFLKTMKSEVHLPPVTNDMCDAVVENFTYIQTNMTEFATVSTIVSPVPDPDASLPFDQWIYNINFNYYGFLGIVITIIVGLISSFITGANSPADANPDLFVPLLNNRRLPTAVRRFFRCGVPEFTESDEVKMEMLEVFDPNGKDETDVQ